MNEFEIHIREWLEVLESENPRDLVELGVITHSIRRMLGDVEE